jgi:hypothetical protein
VAWLTSLGELMRAVAWLTSLGELMRAVAWLTSLGESALACGRKRAVNCASSHEGSLLVGDDPGVVVASGASDSSLSSSTRHRGHDACKQQFNTSFQSDKGPSIP